MRDDTADAMSERSGSYASLTSAGVRPGQSGHGASRYQASFAYHFRGPIDRIWEALADTARYNEAGGLPLHRITETAQPDGTQLFRGQARFGPTTITWNDLPCNWVRNRWLEHTRLFENGPLTRLTARLELTPAEAGCHGVNHLEAPPRNLLGRTLVSSIILAKGIAHFRRQAAKADAWACGEREVPYEAPAPELQAESRRRAERIGRELAGAAQDATLARRLLALVLDGMENDVARIRPLALARHWQAEPEKVIRLCLEATRRGLLALSWDLLCPRCRGAKLRAPALDELPRGAHCPTCAVDYDRDFSRNVEATFRPAEAIRPLAAGEFCLMGPMSTPHIAAHLSLPPDGRRELDFELPAGPYRLRTLEPGPELSIEHPGGPLPAIHYDGEAIASGPGAPVLHNASRFPRTFVIEERAWVRDALTADRLTALQSFRDLFSDQVLRPGDEVAIERVAILFSDLRGSTALYERVGDAAAYHRVREHFGYLAALVRQHEGAVVKTIGDAVMAVFADPARGVAAALAMQDHIDELNRGSEAPVVLKVGLHAGACIAVTLNDRLDYFGRTVNLAARLQGQSRGGDVVVSLELAQEPEVSALLALRGSAQEEAALRGFASPIRFLRLERTPQKVPGSAAATGR